MRKPCCDKQEKNKGAWSKQEDRILVDFIRKHGEGAWHTLPQAAGLLRCGKSCRLRWINYLRPDLKRGNFAEDEEDLIIKLHALLGNRWSLIAGRLPGRTDNEVKNYWNSHLRRKLINMGIDPNNHRISQSLFHPQNPQNSATATSCGLNSHTQPHPAKSCADNNEQVSDTGSFLEDEPPCTGLPDLNIDLTIYSPHSVAAVEEKQKDDHEASNITSRELGFTPSSTLLLFKQQLLSPITAS